MAFIAACEGMEYSILLRRSSVPQKSMDFRQFKTRLQDLDSFPDDGGSQNQFHKIVKKQMAISDYSDVRKNKRSLANLQGSFGADDGKECKDDRNVKRAVSNSESRERYYQGQGLNAPSRKTRNILKKVSDSAADAPDKAPSGSTGGLPRVYVKVADKNSRWSYYECEGYPNGFNKLRHRRWPKGQFFANRYLRSLDLNGMTLKRCRKARRSDSEQRSSFDNPEDSEPANEWLDASKGVVQKIPSEFKPKKKPGLKIYHLRVKRKLDEVLQNKIVEGHRAIGSRHLIESHMKPPTREKIGTHGARHHLPRSFVIRINRKDWRDSNEEKIADKDESDSDEEDEESDEEDDEDAEDEDETDDDEDNNKQASAKAHKCRESFKDLLRSAKAAVANRAKVAEPARLSETSQKGTSSVKSMKSEATVAPRESKNVLIDTSIKVNGAISDVFRNVLKEKDDSKKFSPFEDSFITDRGSQDQMDPELLRM